MGKQIVAMQAGLQAMAQQFPAAFQGYTLQVRTQGLPTEGRDTTRR
jgi:hypothetical protein